MKQFKSLFSVFMLMSAILAGFIACDKDNDDDSVNSDLVKLLTSKSWQITSVKLNPGISIMSMEFSELINFIDQCYRDDYSTFNEDGTLLYNEGQKICDTGSDSLIPSGTWELNSDETVLTVKTTTSTIEFKVLSYTNEKAVLSTSFDVLNDQIELNSELLGNLNIPSTTVIDLTFVPVE